MCACVRERERARESVCVCVCVCESVRERKCVAITLPLICTGVYGVLMCPDANEGL